MRLELQRKTDGAGLMIVVIGRRRSIAIPLAQGLSVEIDKMLKDENVVGSIAIPPQNFRGALSRNPR